MAENFGLKIGVEGEKDFKRALSDINSSFKVLGSEMKLVESQFGKNDTSVSGLTARNEVLNKQIETQKDKIETLKAALENSATSFGENDKRTKAWQVQLNNAEAALNSMEREFKENASAADKMGDEVAKSGKEAEKSEGKFEGLRNTLSKIGTVMGTVTTAAAAVGAAAVAAGKKIWDMASDTAAAGDEIDKQSQKLGLSAESYQKLDYAMERCGADVEDFKKGTINISKALADVQNGVEGAGSSFDTLGVSLKNSDGSMRSTEDVLLDSIDALASMQDETQRNALANEIFGKSYQELAPLLNSGSEGIKALMQEAEDYGMVMSDDAVAASAAFEDSLTKLQGTITGVKNKMMGELLPGITSIVDGFTELVNGSEEGADMIKQGVEDAINTITGMIPQIVSLLSTIAQALIESAPSVLKALANSIIKLLPGILQSFLNDVLPELVSVVVDIAGDLIKSLAEALPSIMKSLATALVSAIKTLFTADKIKEMVKVLIDLVKSLIEGLKQALPILIEGVFTLVNGIIEALPDIISMLVQEIPSIVQSLSDALTDNIPIIIEGSIKLFMGIIEAIPQIIVELVKAIPQIITAIVNGLLDGVSEVFSAAGELFFGIKSSSEDAIEALEDHAEELKAYGAAWDEVNAKIADVNSLLTENGDTLEELQSRQKTAEDGITEILQEALKNQQDLRTEDIEKIREYMDELNAIAEEKLEIYRLNQISELKKLELEKGEITEESAAQHMANAQAALDSANAATEEAYTSRLTTIEQTYSAMNEIGSQAYQNDIAEAKNWYDTAMAQNKEYYTNATSIAAESASNWVEVDSSKWEALSGNMENFKMHSGKTMNQWAFQMKNFFGGYTGFEEAYASTLNKLVSNEEVAFFNMLAVAKQSGNELSDENKRTAKNILDSFEDLPGKMDGVGKSALSGMVSGMQDEIPALKNMSEMSADEIVKAIKSYLDIQSPSKVMAELGKYAGKGLEKGLSDYQAEISQSSENLGENLVSGLWNGISQNADWLWNNISGWLSNLWDGLKGFFGIHSPSKKMRDGIGKQLIRGLAEGIIQEGDTAVSAMEKLSESISSVLFLPALLDFSSITESFNNAIPANIDNQLNASVMAGYAFGNTGGRVPQTVTANISFGDVTINDGSDVEDLAHQVSDIIVSDIMAKGGAYA